VKIRWTAVVLALAFFPGLAGAQTLPAALPSLAGFTIGEPLATVRDRMGDPLVVDAADGQSIWRYLTPDGAAFADLLVKDNVVLSITVLRRFPTSAFALPNTIAFGMHAEDVRKALGPATHERIMQDDGSLDLWYQDANTAWIYEFKNDVLGFIQVVVSPAQRAALEPGPPVSPGDGSSPERAVLMAAMSLPAVAGWIDAYLHEQTCAGGGRWIEQSTHGEAGYTVVHATCAGGSGQRDFYFDARRAVTEVLASPAPEVL